MKLLAFETSTEACSVALLADGEVRERFALAPRRHAELALPWAEQLLAEAGLARVQLDAIAVTRGPGAFTGVRLGIGLAQGIALGLDLPVVALSTLQVLARRAPDAAGQVLATIDARMGEVYAAAYQSNGQTWLELVPECVRAPQLLELPGTQGRWAGVGTGLAVAEGLLQHRFAARLAWADAAALPHAADVLALARVAFVRGQVCAPEQIEPAYLRDTVALTLVQQHAARAVR